MSLNYQKNSICEHLLSYRPTTLIYSHKVSKVHPAAVKVCHLVYNFSLPVTVWSEVHIAVKFEVIPSCFHSFSLPLVCPQPQYWCSCFLYLEHFFLMHVSLLPRRWRQEVLLKHWYLSTSYKRQESSPHPSLLLSTMHKLNAVCRYISGLG